MMIGKAHRQPGYKVVCLIILYTSSCHSHILGIQYKHASLLRYLCSACRFNFKSGDLLYVSFPPAFPLLFIFFCFYSISLLSPSDINLGINALFARKTLDYRDLMTVFILNFFFSFSYFNTLSTVFFFSFFRVSR